MEVKVLQQKEVWVYPEGMGPGQHVATEPGANAWERSLTLPGEGEHKVR